jgi:hypothetical protein
MDLGSLLSPVSVTDLIAKRVRVTLDGVEYILPVKSMRDNRVWEVRLDRELVRLLNLVREDSDDATAVLRALTGSSWPFIDLLISYDTRNILPDRDTIDATESEIGLLIACLEVWRAAHPLADIGIETFATAGQSTSALPELTSSLSPNGAGPTTTSRTN